MPTNGYQLEVYVGERVVGRFHQRRGSLMAKPPQSHPVVNVMDVGPKAILAHTTAPLEDRVADCEVTVTTTLLERLGPVKTVAAADASTSPAEPFAAPSESNLREPLAGD